jgi:octaprenyl-diphosphate synthase
MQHGTPHQCNLVRECIENGESNKFDEILDAITRSGALDYSRKQAEAASVRAIQALDQLPDNDFKEALVQLAHFSVDRNH